MTHRKQNRDGYKKIFPMSLSEDCSFCHYCGRGVEPDLQLQWDHVPALNVRIPNEYGIKFDIKKTLIRSCSECNLLASDTPHLDYLERHFWLKTRYLSRYKSTLIKSDPKLKDEIIGVDGKRNTIGFHTLLFMLGFGIKDTDQIDSSILESRNVPSGRTIKALIEEHMTGSPHDVEEEIQEEPTGEEEEHITELIDEGTDDLESLKETLAKLQESKSSDSVNWLNKHKMEIAIVFMKITEGKAINGKIISSEEFFRFIHLTGMDEKTYKNFMNHHYYRSYNHFFPELPETFYGISVPEWRL